VQATGFDQWAETNLDSESESESEAVLDEEKPSLAEMRSKFLASRALRSEAILTGMEQYFRQYIESRLAEEESKQHSSRIKVKKRIQRKPKVKLMITQSQDADRMGNAIGHGLFINSASKREARLDETPLTHRIPQKPRQL